MNPSLMVTVIAELAARKGAWPEIARATDCSYSWICKLASNGIPNPGIRQLERLNTYFLSNPLPSPVKPESTDSRAAA